MECAKKIMIICYSFFKLYKIKRATFWGTRVNRVNHAKYEDT